MFETEIEEVETREIAPSPMVNANQSVMQVRSSFATAVHVQKPRNLREVEKEFLQEADLAGASFYYGWGVQDKSSGKNKAVEGPSIGLAKSLMRCWGNCAVEMLPVQETPQAYFFNAAFIDLEKGVTITRPFRQSKSWQVYGKMDEQRKEDVRFQIGASKAIRNVVKAALPEWLIQKGLERAKKGEMQKLDDYIKKNGLEKAREVIVDELKKFGVSLELILAKLERPTIAAITKEDMVLLKGDIQALRTGQDSLESLYPFKGNIANNAGENANGKTKAESLKQELQQRAAKQQEQSESANGKTIVTVAGDEVETVTGEVVSESTGETVAPAEPQEKGQDAPYPDNWPENRKATRPKGYAMTWNDQKAASPKFLEKLRKEKSEEALWEMRFRIDAQGEAIPADAKLYDMLVKLQDKK